MRRVAPEVAPDMVLHQRLPRPAGPVRRALLDGPNAGGRHRGASRPRQRGPQRRRPAGGELRPRAQARRLYFGLRAEGVGAEIPEHAADSIRCVHCQHALAPPGVPVAPRGLRVPRMRKQAAGPGHRGHRRSGVAGRGRRHHRRDAGGTMQVRVPLPGLHNVYNAAAALAGAFALGALSRKRAVRSRRLAPGVRTP